MHVMLLGSKNNNCICRHESNLNQFEVFKKQENTWTTWFNQAAKVVQIQAKIFFRDTGIHLTESSRQIQPVFDHFLKVFLLPE